MSRELDAAVCAAVLGEPKPEVPPPLVVVSGYDPDKAVGEREAKVERSPGGLWVRVYLEPRRPVDPEVDWVPVAFSTSWAAVMPMLVAMEKRGFLWTLSRMPAGGYMAAFFEKEPPEGGSAMIQAGRTPMEALSRAAVAAVGAWVPE